MKRYPIQVPPAGRGRLRPSLTGVARDLPPPAGGSSPPAVNQSFETCLCCREPIRVYEPIIVVEHEGERETSLAREPDLPERARGLVLHARCAPAGWRSNA